MRRALSWTEGAFPSGNEAMLVAPGLAEDLDAVAVLGEAVDESHHASGAGDGGAGPVAGTPRDAGRPGAADRSPTNRLFKDWPKVFPYALNAQVIAERLTERAEHFLLDGKRYRSTKHSS